MLVVVDPLVVIMPVVIVYGVLGVDRIHGRFLDVYGCDLCSSCGCGVNQEVGLLCLLLVVRENGLHGW